MASLLLSAGANVDGRYFRVRSADNTHMFLSNDGRYLFVYAGNYSHNRLSMYIRMAAPLSC